MLKNSLGEHGGSKSSKFSYYGEVRMKQEKSELAAAQAELRDLKRTVLALRQELEAAHSRADERLHAAEALYKAEAVQLKMTITALRNELGHSFAEQERLVQQAVSANHNEINQLK
ncbi:MAG TPA: hypothetical protein VGD24_07180, partial [Gallionella sp.]